MLMDLLIKRPFIASLCVLIVIRMGLSHAKSLQVTFIIITSMLEKFLCI